MNRKYIQGKQFKIYFKKSLFKKIYLISKLDYKKILISKKNLK